MREAVCTDSIGLGKGGRNTQGLEIGQPRPAPDLRILFGSWLLTVSLLVNFNLPTLDSVVDRFTFG